MKTNSTWQPRVYILVTGAKPYSIFAGIKLEHNGCSIAWTEDLAEANRLTENEARCMAPVIQEVTGLTLHIVNLWDFLSEEQVLLLRVFFPVENEWGFDADEAETAMMLYGDSAGET